VEHIIVSDGPDPELYRKVMGAGCRGVRFLHELREHGPEPHWGSNARNAGLIMARGEFITYCDDDDSLRPFHVTTLVNALLENPECGFAFSGMDCHMRNGSVTGLVPNGPLPEFGVLGSPCIMHRRVTSLASVWGPGSGAEDYELVARWMKAGVRGIAVPVVTSDCWPSSQWQGREEA
jgi:glycosyltransferase involved in cell wall biosynthesis